jgi:hypothetical protein
MEIGDSGRMRAVRAMRREMRGRIGISPVAINRSGLWRDFVLCLGRCPVMADATAPWTLRLSLSIIAARIKHQTFKGTYSHLIFSHVSIPCYRCVGDVGRGPSRRGQSVLRRLSIHTRISRFLCCSRRRARSWRCAVARARCVHGAAGRPARDRGNSPVSACQNVAGFVVGAQTAGTLHWRGPLPSMRAHTTRRGRCRSLGRRSGLRGRAIRDSLRRRAVPPSPPLSSTAHRGASPAGRVACPGRQVVVWCDTALPGGRQN